MEAWLVLRVAMPGDVEAVVTVLSGDLSTEAVRQQVERMYVDMTASIDEKIEYASGSRIRYLAKSDKMKDSRPAIHCGHNPWLEARLVSNLRFEEREDGKCLLLYADGNKQQEHNINALPPHSF